MSETHHIFHRVLAGVHGLAIMRCLMIKSLSDMKISESMETGSTCSFRTCSERKPSREETPRFRNSGPKSRTGCITCKIRRVKCGEEKPSCLKCTSTGRKCDGYEEPKPRPKSKSKPKMPLPKLQAPASKQTSRHARTSSSLALGNPSVDIEGSFEERRSFHYFRSRNMASMPGNFEPYFWDHLILQFSHRDPTIRSSLIALSATYEEHEQNRASQRSSQSVYVLQQYTKALRHLADSLLTGQVDPRVTLISCLIFIRIEFMQNNLELGFKHLESGLQILRDLKGRRPGLGDGEELYGVLERSFRRLSIQASIHGRLSSFDLDKTSWTNPWTIEDAVPESFISLFEARNYTDGMLSEVFACMRQVRNSPKFGTQDQLEDLFLMDSICASFLDRLQQWQRATQYTISAQFADVDQDHLPPPVAYLQLFHTYMTIILKTPFATSEMVFDGYTAEFARLVELAALLLANPVAQDPPVLSSDMGILPPLFLLVLKCRDVRLRRQALALLERAPEQEGLWRRAPIVAFSEWKIAFEEQGRGGLDEQSILPEEARIYQERVVHEVREGVIVPCISFRRSSVSLVEPPESVEMSRELEETMAMGNMV